MWLITVNPVTINQKSVVNTSNNYPRPLNLSLKDKAKINYYYDSRFIDKRKDDMAFSIKSTELQKGETTNFKVIQKYRNEFFVPVIEKNEIKIKKI
ncbi:hypothetical protein [Lactobacillus sp. S2-2]|uniref:hypothetical protein n=1 Tax=Lactobacillus sp. S2-2 TaxID=2692917 RepID=UPI001F2BFD22|nr:hypothetical protein [Lactobacillus sp. S2-2]